MSRKFQFSLRRLLSAVLLFALALLLLRIVFESEDHQAAITLFPAVLGSAFGRLCGRAWVGAFIGAFCLPIWLLLIVVVLASRE